MFFVMGGGQDAKQLDFNQIIVCPNCQKYGQISVHTTYSYVSFFFIPLFKWNKKYYAKMNCCGAVCEISRETGQGIERGDITMINENELHFARVYNPWKTCGNCGYSTEENFEYCPKCGTRF